MRTVLPQQLQLGQSDIAAIQFDVRSRDDIPQILQGLQFIYTTPELRDNVFSILEGLVPEGVSSLLGRPGMDLWKILVLGTLRVNLNCDYDRLLEMANQHRTLRQMLGHGLRDDGDEYKLQTIKDNVDLLTEASLDQINQLVVEAGHTLLKKEKALSARCDSFVVETAVHYPTDTNLLWDAIRCALRVVGQCCEARAVSTWRQWQYNTRQARKAFRKTQQLRPSNSKDSERRAERQQAIAGAYEAYLDLCSDYLGRMETTLRGWGISGAAEVGTREAELQRWIQSGWKQINLIRRRVLEGETIPHQEKVFSLFEPHTEWLCKGKAGVPVELGLNVCIMEASSGFILHHKVMQQCTDSDVAVDMVKETQTRFPKLTVCSFDKGFHSLENQRQLAELLDRVVMPCKGKLSKARRTVENDPDFVKTRHQHSAVESGINALEVHGLDRCPDRGLEHFKRYVALAVVGRNLQKLGAILQAEALEKQQREDRRQRKKRRQCLAA